MILAMIVEGVLFLFYLNMHNRHWEVLAHIEAKTEAPHSIYTMAPYEAPIYTWTHRHSYFDSQSRALNRTIVYRADKNPPFARIKQSVPYPLITDYDFNSCFILIDDI